MNIVVKLYAEVVTRRVINVRASSVIISACLHVILVVERAVETVSILNTRMVIVLLNDGDSDIIDRDYINISSNDNRFRLSNCFLLYTLFQIMSSLNELNAIHNGYHDCNPRLLSMIP